MCPRSNTAEMFVPGHNSQHAHIISVYLRGYCTSYPKLASFCALSQNNQHLLEKKYIYIHLIVTFSRNSKWHWKVQ